MFSAPYCAATLGLQCASNHSAYPPSAPGLLAAAAAGAFCGVSLRPQVVFGPGDPLFTEDMLLSARPPPAMGSGAAYYTPIYVRNLAAYVARLAHELTTDAPLAARLSGVVLFPCTRSCAAFLLGRTLRRLLTVRLADAALARGPSPG